MNGPYGDARNALMEEQVDQFLEQTAVGNEGDNFQQPILSNLGEVARNAVPNMANTLAKNISNSVSNILNPQVGTTDSFQLNRDFSLGSSPMPTSAPTLAPNFGGNAYQRTMGFDITGGEKIDFAKKGFDLSKTLGKAVDFLKTNTMDIQSGAQAIGSVLGARDANRELAKNIDNMEKSIGDLTDVSQTITADYGEDARRINTDLNEAMQASAQNLLSQVQIPKELNTNLSVGASSQTAQDIDKKIKTRLNTLFDSQKSKAKDIAEKLNVSASSATAKISSTKSAMQEEIEKMEQAQKNNKLNAALDVIGAGGSILGIPGSMTIASQFKKSNEYS